MTTRRASLLALSAVCFGGCATSPEPAFSDVAQMVEEREGGQVRWNDGAGVDDGAEKIVRELLAAPLDVDDAVQVALLRHPALRAVFEELQVAQSDLLQAWLPENPEVDLGVRFGLPSLAAVEVEASIVQNVIALAFAPLQARLAGTALEAAKLRVADAVLERAARVKDAWYEHVAAKELLAIETTQAVADEAAAELAARQMEAGTESDLTVATRIAASLQARLRVAEAELDVERTREGLTREMGLFGQELTWRVPERLPALPAADTEIASLEALAIAQRLDVALARQEIDLAAQRLSLAQPWFVPFFDVGVQGERDASGDLSLGPRVGFALPIFDWGQARRQRLEAERRAAEQRLAALSVDARSRVRDAGARLTTARATVEYVHASLLPAQSRVVDLSLAHYNRMFVSVFDVLRARQDELAVERDEVLARRRYWQARAQLEREVGGRLPAATTTSAPPPAPAPAPAAPIHDHP